MDVLTITTLYPNALQPRHGIFVRNRLSEMDKIDGFHRKVIAPVPHCPLIGLLSDRFKRYENMPDYELNGGIDVYHPKYFTLPGVSFFDNASSMAKAVNDTIDKLEEDAYNFDIVDGQYLYPDGVAAYKVAKKYNKPLVLTARGSDVNYWMTQRPAKSKILESIDYASKVICVSEALKNELIRHGVDETKLVVIINGVNPDYFNEDIPANPLREEYFLSVGNLVPLKGHHITLNALADLHKKRLIIIGDGEQRRSLKKQAKDLGLQGRVQFIKHIDQEKLAEFYAGATATILMSEMEGMPNVVLESLATGTPVIACDVGGISEIVNDKNGILLRHRSEYDLLDAIEHVEDINRTRSEISSTVREYRWSDVASRQYKIYVDAVQASD